MSIQLQQQITGLHTSSTSMAITLATVPKSQSLLVAMIFTGTIDEDPISITGGGVTWAKAISQSPDGYNSGSLWYGYNASGSGTTSIVATVATSTNIFGIVAEFTGVQSTANPLLQTALAVGNTSPATAGIITTNPTDLVVSMLCNEYDATCSAASNGFNLFAGLNQGAAILSGAYNTAGASNTAFTLSSYSNHWMAGIASFAAAPPPVPLFSSIKLCGISGQLVLNSDGTNTLEIKFGS